MDIRNQSKYCRLLEEAISSDQEYSESLRQLQQLKKPLPQPYEKDIQNVRRGEYLLGFHKAYWGPNNRKLIQHLSGESVFLHFFLSYHKMEQGKLLVESEEGLPAIYQRNDWFNFGITGILRTWNDTMMFMGWYDYILTDLKIFEAPASRKFKSGHDMVTDLWHLVNNELALSEKESIRSDEAMESHRISIAGIKDWNTFRKAAMHNKNFWFSIVLSKETARALKASIPPDAKPLCQIPFGLGGYHWELKELFQYDEARVSQITLGPKPLKLFAICSGIYGLKNGAILDVEDGIVTGTLRILNSFLLQAEQNGLLKAGDQNY